MQLHLNTYGTYLHVKDAMFDVRRKADDGTVTSKEVAPQKVKSVWMGRGTMLSAEAVRLALQHNVDIVFLESSGQPLGRVWHSKLGSTTLIRKRQLEASMDERALRYTLAWIGQKLDNQAELLRDLKKHRTQHGDYLNEKIGQLAELRGKVAGLTLKEGWENTVQGLEGTAGRLYFEALSAVLLPPWQFAGRSSRPAQDPFNAFLNYAYGVLYARTEKALMLAGADPFVGFLHRDGYNLKSMAFDFIEPYRIWADKTVFSLFSAKKVNQSHYETGAARAASGVSAKPGPKVAANANHLGIFVNSEGKKLLMEAFNAYLEADTLRYKGRNRTRMGILLLDAHRFAQELLTGSGVGSETELELDITEL